ncbi:MAG: CHAP domain-containing protein [Clostridiales bacterium]|nr:CHAP domain-containing protein [Clostridiales bacterium]
MGAMCLGVLYNNICSAETAALFPGGKTDMDCKLMQKAEKNGRFCAGAWRKLMCLFCALALCLGTVFAVPADSEGETAFCGIPYHVHTIKCYKQRTKLSCTYESLEVHKHEKSCYNDEGLLACGKADYLVHEHVEECYDKLERLVCAIPEKQQHTHGEECYRIEGAHAHTAECYTEKAGEMVCPLAEEAGHSHDANCYERGALLCEMTENHAHTSTCYTEGKLICATNEHAHSDSCYGLGGSPLCGIAENHYHGNGCYTAPSLQCAEEHEHANGCYSESTLVCSIAEGHAHGASCYERVLNCGAGEHSHSGACYSEKILSCSKQEGHVHADSCYEKALVCGMTESEGHAHTEACFETVQALQCEQPESEGQKVLACGEVQANTHEHSKDCYELVDPKKLTCKKAEDGVHFHDKMCYGYWDLICKKRVHVHELICYSDPTADLEEPWRWEYIVSKVALTGVWADDVIAIAESQLGYRESRRNYIVEEDGETIKGYTRYGEWYGAPYSDWCAMFISFCLKYAGVEGMPRDATCRVWIEELSDPEVNLYFKAGTHEPQRGDLVFFDIDNNGKSDHVSLVVDTDGGLTVIEGNVENKVKTSVYAADDPTIIGYGVLPEQKKDEAVLEEEPDAGNVDENFRAESDGLRNLRTRMEDIK